MRALFDVNVLIALLDGSHAFHDQAHAWWSENADYGWSSCPIVENGVVRIMSNTGYSPSHRFRPEEVLRSLTRFVAATNHEFWPDTLSLRDRDVFPPDRVLRSSAITDLYLLALASHHDARLVTFDKQLSIDLVTTARERNLCIL